MELLKVWNATNSIKEYLYAIFEEENQIGTESILSLKLELLVQFFREIHVNLSPTSFPISCKSPGAKFFSGKLCENEAPAKI